METASLGSRRWLTSPSGHILRAAWLSLKSAFGRPSGDPQLAVTIRCPPGENTAVTTSGEVTPVLDCGQGLLSLHPRRVVRNDRAAFVSQSNRIDSLQRSIKVLMRFGTSPAGIMATI